MNENKKEKKNSEQTHIRSIHGCRAGNSLFDDVDDRDDDDGVFAGVRCRMIVWIWNANGWPWQQMATEIQYWCWYSFADIMTICTQGVCGAWLHSMLFRILSLHYSLIDWIAVRDEMCFGVFVADFEFVCVNVNAKSCLFTQRIWLWRTNAWQNIAHFELVGASQGSRMP